LKLVDALAGGFDEGTLDEARRQAMVAALTLIGALTVSRVVTDQALSDAILRSAQNSITGSQTGKTVFRRLVLDVERRLLRALRCHPARPRPCSSLAAGAGRPRGPATGWQSGQLVDGATPDWPNTRPTTGSFTLLLFLATEIVMLSCL